MQNSVFGYWLVCVLMFVACSGAQALEGPGGPLQLNDFPGASIESRAQTDERDYMVALGNYRKVRGLWRVEELRTSGELTRTTYRLPDNHSAREGFDFFARQLAQYPLRELYVCQSRDCGESNSWANNHFNVYQLYGLDQYQYYGAYELSLPEETVYVTLYAVLRGNKRVYVQLEVLSSDGAETGSADRPLE